MFYFLEICLFKINPLVIETKGRSHTLDFALQHKRFTAQKHSEIHNKYQHE